MTLETLQKKDYSKVIGYAITEMHLDWYMSSKIILNAYGKYFLYMELNRATQIIAAYEGDELAGVLLADYKSKVKTDGELIFLAADPNIKGKGTGTVLLEELRRREPEKRIYLFTDSACTYQFYEHRGFDRIAEEHVDLELENRRVPLDCYLYSREL